MKSGFVVKQGKVSGTAGMIARAEGAKASYEWRCSLDGERWKDLPSTVQIHQDVAGLVAYRTLTKAGPDRIAAPGPARTAAPDLDPARGVEAAPDCPVRL